MLPWLIDSAATQESGQQRLNYIDGTHLALPSGKLVLLKNIQDNLDPILSVFFSIDLR